MMFIDINVRSRAATNRAISATRGQRREVEVRVDFSTNP
jgi:hypothetical protein